MSLQALIAEEKRKKEQKSSLEEKTLVNQEIIEQKIKEFAKKLYEEQMRTALAKQLAEDPMNKTVDFVLDQYNGVNIQYPFWVGIPDLIEEDDYSGQSIVTNHMAKFYIKISRRNNKYYEKTPYYNIFYNELKKCAQNDEVEVSDIRLKEFHYQLQKKDNAYGFNKKSKNYHFVGYRSLEDTKLEPLLPPCLIYNYENKVEFHAVLSLSFLG